MVGTISVRRHRRRIRGITISKKTQNRGYLFGDFDKDGTKNIDDKYPFDKARKDQVNKEIKLASAISRVERKRREAEKLAKRFNTHHNFDSYRVKDTYSTINKLVKSNPQMTNDFIGLRKEEANRRTIRQRWRKFNQKIKNKHEIKDVDDTYKTNKNTKKLYRAMHTNFVLDKFGAEAQFRTNKYGKLNDEMHAAYKQGKSSKPFIEKSKKLLKEGY